MSCLMPQWEKNQWFCYKQQWQDMLHQKQLILNLKPMEFWLRITSIFVQANLYEIDKIWHEMEAHEEMFNNLENFAYSMNFSDWNIQILAFSFIFVVRTLELFIGIKDLTFGCNVCLFCLTLNFNIVDFKKLEY